MMMPENLFRCSVCGKFIYIPNCELWAYKRMLHIPHHSAVRQWFCSWGCMRKWDAAHPPKVSKMRKGDVLYL